jgi:1-aminocyclopropane-1-carboxylate deaminase/D-cysteine desulfhydrase-like pyridoxal-dependent ACC family enzyme
MNLREPKIINPALAITTGLDLPDFSKAGILVDVLRLDKVHPVISGNKWFKLKNYLTGAIQGNCKTILTFGGAFSNHLVAAACLAKAAGLRSVGVIRGERAPVLSHTLQDAQSYGMELEFISRQDYRHKDSPEFLGNLQKKFPAACIIPEGGSGLPGVEGSSDILGLVPAGKYSHLLCAIGTGTMFQGLANASTGDQQVVGVCVLKGMRDLLTDFSHQFLNPDRRRRCSIYYDYHFGGYGRKNAGLFQFMNRFFEETGIETDFVYTAKLFYGVIDLVRKEKMAPGSRLMIIHSGGLQGNHSLARGTLNF